MLLEGNPILCRLSQIWVALRNGVNDRSRQLGIFRDNLLAIIPAIQTKLALDMTGPWPNAFVVVVVGSLSRFRFRFRSLGGWNFDG